MLQKFLIASILALASSTVAHAQMMSISPVDIVVARVHGEDILMGEVDREIKERPQYEKMLTAIIAEPGLLSELRPIVLEAIITRKLLHKAAEENTAIDRDQVKLHAQRAYAELKKQEFSEEPTFRHRNQDKRSLAQQIYQDFIVRAHIASLSPPELVSEDEIRSFYEERKFKMQQSQDFIRLSHILIEAKDGDFVRAYAKAVQVMNHAQQEEISFSMLARMHSDSNTKLFGGYRGRMSRSELSPEVAKLAFSMKDNEVGGPVKVKEGYQVLKVFEKELAPFPSYSETRDEILAFLLSQKREQIFREELDRLWNQQQVELLMEDRQCLG